MPRTTPSLALRCEPARRWNVAKSAGRRASKDAPSLWPRLSFRHVAKIIEIGRQARTARVEGHQSDKGAGEGAVLAAPGLVGDDAGVEFGRERLPAVAGIAGEDQPRVVDVGGKTHGRAARQWDRRRERECEAAVEIGR